MTTAEPDSARNAGLMRVILGQVCLHITMAGMRMAIPLLALSQGFGEAEVGILVALFGASQIFLSLPAGRFADRSGYKKLAVWSIIGSTASAVIAAIWPIYPVLCLGALICGGSVGTAFITTQYYVGRSARTATQLKQVFSWLSIAPAVAFLIGPLATGLVIDHMGYRWAFLMLAISSSMAWLMVRKAPDLPPSQQIHTATQTSWDLWKVPGFRQLMLLNCLVSSSWDVHNFLVPVLGYGRGMSAATIGGVLGSFALAAACTRLAMPIVARHVNDRDIIGGALVLAGLVFALYPFTESALGMALCSASMGAALGLVSPLVMSVMHQITPAHRHGEALALRFMLLNISGVSMPLLIGIAGGTIGVSATFWGMTAALGSGCSALVGLRAKMERRDK